MKHFVKDMNQEGQAFNLRDKFITFIYAKVKGGILLVHKFDNM